jgi:hypothetical protein
MIETVSDLNGLLLLLAGAVAAVLLIAAMLWRLLH